MPIISTDGTEMVKVILDGLIYTLDFKTSERAARIALELGVMPTAAVRDFIDSIVRMSVYRLERSYEAS
jgi:hypothetical protein